MFCKECGTENIDTQVECIKCKTIINSNLPLSGTERVMIIAFFGGLAATIFFGIIPIIICLGLIYIIKKDKSIKPLETAKKVFLGYLVDPEKVNISERILNFSTNNYQFDY